jgi:hypothetical protein
VEVEKSVSEEKANEKQSSLTNESKSEDSHDDRNVEDEWYVIYSEALQQPFYYNKVLKMGRFLPVPANVKPISDIPPGSQLHQSEQLLPQSQIKDTDHTVTVIDDDIIVTEVKKGISEEDKWECSLCTFANKEISDKCEMCENPKKQHRRSQRKLSQTQSSFFSCNDDNLSPFPLSKKSKH